MEPFSPDAAPISSTHPSADSALGWARRLADLLDELAADAPRADRYEYRLAQALAGGLVDQLEVIAGRRGSDADPDDSGASAHRFRLT